MNKKHKITTYELSAILGNAETLINNGTNSTDPNIPEKTPTKLSCLICVYNSLIGESKRSIPLIIRRGKGEEIRFENLEFKSTQITHVQQEMRSELNKFLEDQSVNDSDKEATKNYVEKLLKSPLSIRSWRDYRPK